jgi:phage shock protein E
MSWFAKIFGATAGASPQDLPTDALLIDVRSEGEFAGGHLQGALSLPLSRIDVEIARHAPDRQAPLVLYCQSGARSGRACNVLAQMGYTRVHNTGSVNGAAALLSRSVTRGV